MGGPGMSCQAKDPLPFPAGPLFMLCGAPSTAVYDYWCACGRHSRRGETCEAHRPVAGDVGCVQCFTLDVGAHDCAMEFVEVAEGPAPPVVVAAGGLLVCDLCGAPVVSTAAGLMHGDVADSVFCALFNPRARGVGSGGSE